MIHASRHGLIFLDQIANSNIGMNHNSILFADGYIAFLFLF